MKSMPSWSQLQEVGTVDQQANADTAITFLPEREGEYAQRSTTYASLGMSQWTHFSVLFIESITRKIQQNYIWKQRPRPPPPEREGNSSQVSRRRGYISPMCHTVNPKTAGCPSPICHTATTNTTQKVSYTWETHAWPRKLFPLSASSSRKCLFICWVYVYPFQITIELMLCHVHWDNRTPSSKNMVGQEHGGVKHLPGTTSSGWEPLHSSETLHTPISWPAWLDFWVCHCQFNVPQYTLISG